MGGPALTSQVLASEPYAFPVPAPSTGDGSTTTYNGRRHHLRDRAEPGRQPAVGPGQRDPGARRRARPVDRARRGGCPGRRHGHQGRRGLVRDQHRPGTGDQARAMSRRKARACCTRRCTRRRRGQATMVYTITSATMNPSAAFSVLGSPGIKVVGAGAGPHWSFADAPPFNTPGGVTTPGPARTRRPGTSGWRPSTSRRPLNGMATTTGAPTCSRSAGTEFPW